MALTAYDFWNSVRPSGLTAEEELVELWQRLRDCVPREDNVSLVPWSQARWVRGWPKVHIPVPPYLEQAREEDEIIQLVIIKFLEELQKQRS